MHVLLTSLAAITLLTAYAAPARPVAAQASFCPCMAPGTAMQTLRQVSDVVEAVAVDKWTTLEVDNTHYAGHFTWMPVEAYRFRVVRKWKGTEGEELRLDQGYSFCDHHFAIGRRYLLFLVSYDMPAIMFAPVCYRLIEGEEISSYAANLGPPTVSFDVPDTIEVPLAPPWTRRLSTYLIASLSVYSWMSASRGTGLAREAWPYSSSGNRMPALCAAWVGSIASVLAFIAGIVAMVRRPRRLVVYLLAQAAFIFAVGVVFPGWVMIRTNGWLADAALSWADAPVAAPPIRYERYRP